MKLRISTTWVGLVLALALVLAGRAQNTSQPVPPAPQPSPPAPKSPAIPLENPSGPGAGVPQISPDKNPPLPPGLRLSFWTSEIVKLAQAGIDDSVLLAYVDDAGMFNLGADQIIYLSDLGVSAPVITTMLQHDFEFAAGNRPADAWVMPSPQSTIRLIFTTNSSPAKIPAASSAGGSSAATAKSSSDNRSEPNRGFAVAEPAGTGFWVNEESPDHFARSPIPMTPAGSKPKLYAVREPYPEQITDTIVLFRAPEIVPNVLIVEFFP